MRMILQRIIEFEGWIEYTVNTRGGLGLSKTQALCAVPVVAVLLDADHERLAIMLSEPK